MKLSDLNFLGAGDDQESLDSLIYRFNQTEVDYPQDKTIGRLFGEQAERTPRAIAVRDRGRSYTYRQLDRDSNRLARFLVDRGLGPDTFGAVMLDRSYAFVVALLGVFKAGAAYFPVNPELPHERIKYMLRDAGARVLLTEKRHVKKANDLQWECPALETLLCLDSRDVHGEIEEPGERMKGELWDYIGQEAFDDISGGGWKSSYTGEWLPRDVMDEYGDNVVRKLSPYLRPEARVLEVGCSSGISMFRLAPLVGFYYGTDLSGRILRNAERERQRRGLGNIRLKAAPAHELDQLDERDFDAVILNSVIQSFSGLNYLRHVLGLLIGLMKDSGVIFLGNVWDQELKEDYVQSLVAFRREHAGQPYRSKDDVADGLFVAKGFLEDLSLDFPEIASVECSPMLLSTRNELSAYSYDAVLHVKKAEAATAALPPGPRTRNKYQFDLKTVEAYADTRPGTRGDAGSLAYLIYTSGSTGQPKGVQVEMRSLVNLCYWYKSFCPVEAGSSVIQVIPCSFDASVKNFLTPLIFGAKLVLFKNGPFDPAELLTAIEEEQVNVINCGVPSMFYPVVELAAKDDYAGLGSLRCLALGGEATDLSRLKAWLLSPNCRATLANIYGPTECADISLCYKVGPEEVAGLVDIPIGKPVHNAQCYVLDSRGRPEPVGVVGELCISGEGLARGYLNRPDLTAEKFVAHPFAHGQRMYRTGDLAKRLADGNIVFVGRVDRQVKIRGFRIELGEIESQLRRVEGVGDAVAVGREDVGGSKYLCAYLTAANKIPAAALREVLARSLPDYMIPSHFVFLNELPINLHGKVDIKALPAPDETETLRHSGYVSPRDETEETLCRIWAALLGVKRVGIAENFFQVGGHSLKAVALSRQISKELGVELPLSALYRAQTIETQAAWIKSDQRARPAPSSPSSLQLLNEERERQIFCFPPITGFAWSFAELARHAPELAVYAFDFVERQDRFTLYADAIQSVRPRGPYLLCGYSAGGALAFRVTKELESRGESVSDLILFDSMRREQPPGYSREYIRQMAEHCLGDPKFLDHLADENIRRRLYNKILSYGDYYSTTVDDGRVNATITLIISESSTAEMAAGWRNSTSGRVRVLRGKGAHGVMLDRPNLDENLSLLSGILEGVG